MGERRPRNSELRLRRLEQEDADPDEERGILVIFDRDERPSDDDPRARDDDAGESAGG